jgi:putative selenate reductase
MTAEMRPLSFAQLLEWALAEHTSQGSIYGIPKALFNEPRADRRFETRRPFGARIGTPFGPAAGPHTQLAQNIVSSWLCGGRWIELKTVQILDRLEIPRPCIEAADRGYNVEWSQELTLDQSAREYANAWALVHNLPHALGFDPDADAVAFNQSVGYTLDGIRREPVQKFLDRMSNGAEFLDPVRHTLETRFPALADVQFPDRISDSVTLSTMHGCPPEEIERIARYLLEERGLNTVVKLNPTLLGRARVTDILHERLGFRDVEIPDEVFEHDLGLAAALDLVSSLRSAAARCGRGFAVKLSNTLAMKNPSGVLPGDMVYMSGRALFPVTIELFRVLRAAVGFDLPVSFSAGADAFNAPGLIAAGACPVTVATDLLKPGGYARLGQYLEELERAMDAAGAASLDAFAAGAPLALEREADKALTDPRYRMAYAEPELPRLSDPLTALDCIAAPCVATCPACQDVPDYAAHLADGSPDAALATILRRNALPAITGHICTARCETRCTRANLDRPVRIRDLKRFAAERGTARVVPAPSTGRRVAVVGAGPSGLAAAHYLALAGVDVTVFEARTRAGGMPAIAPGFRIPRAAVESDVARIASLGVAFRFGAPNAAPKALLEDGFQAVYVATGFALDAALDDVAGLEADGVFGALDILRRVADGDSTHLGARVLVVGGGNTAIDAARTALRLADDVSLLYRRTRAELPADRDEVDEFLAEGGTLVELVSPVAAIAESGRLVAVDCVRNHLGHPGPDGRRRPIPMPETRFRIPADSLILAIGQRVDAERLASLVVTRGPNGEIVADPLRGKTSALGVYAGGDIVRGPATIVEAAADGRRAAAAICDALGVLYHDPVLPEAPDPEGRLARARLARRRKTEPHVPRRLGTDQRRGFDLVTSTLSEPEARAEAARCLQCHLFCDKCVDVCPNRANATYSIPTIEIEAPIVDLATGRAVGAEPVRIAQPHQIVHVIDLCNECGNCATFCVHAGKPFADKPRLALSRAAFDAAEAPALFLEPDGLAGRDADGGEWRLVELPDGFRYTDARLSIDLSPSLRVTAFRVLKRDRGMNSTARAIERAALWRGLSKSPLRRIAEGTKGEP